jgi:hypothetical protein
VNPIARLFGYVTNVHQQSIWHRAHALKGAMRANPSEAIPALCCTRLVRSLEAVKILAK